MTELHLMSLTHKIMKISTRNCSSEKALELEKQTKKERQQQQNCSEVWLPQNLRVMQIKTLINSRLE